MTCNGSICRFGPTTNIAGTNCGSGNNSGGAGTNSGASARNVRDPVEAWAVASRQDDSSALGACMTSCSLRRACKMLAPAAAPSEGDSGGPNGGSRRPQTAGCLAFSNGPDCVLVGKSSQTLGRSLRSAADFWGGLSLAAPSCALGRLKRSGGLSQTPRRRGSARGLASCGLVSCGPSRSSACNVLPRSSGFLWLRSPDAGAVGFSVLACSSSTTPSWRPLPPTQQGAEHVRSWLLGRGTASSGNSMNVFLTRIAVGEFQEGSGFPSCPAVCNRLLREVARGC
mmetsp:Transcript_69961/g.161843  ORF Transcript_69961/g.161843 Transcript_69961/m.161843 type:complete len:283 (-) Transcript_69961:32-880(-)